MNARLPSTRIVKHHPEMTRVPSSVSFPRTAALTADSSGGFVNGAVWSAVWAANLRSAQHFQARGLWAPRLALSVAESHPMVRTEPMVVPSPAKGCGLVFRLDPWGEGHFAHAAPVF